VKVGLCDDLMIECVSVCVRDKERERGVEGIFCLDGGVGGGQRQRDELS